MNQHTIEVNASNCVGCGLCKQDCPMNHISIKDKTAVVQPGACILCGHCAAVCPQNAISITGYDEPPLEFGSTVRLDPQQLLQALQTRRSIRRFQSKMVCPDIVEQIIQAGRFTPSAKNLQNVSYIVLREQTSKIEAIALDYLKKVLPLARVFVKAAKQAEIGEQFFFKGAPVVVLVVSQGGFGKINGALAAANMSLMAEASGLGVLYSGYFTVVANLFRKLRRAVGLKHGEKVITTLVLGYSDVVYRRTAQREPAAVQYL